jgi:hypothetical protein
MSSTCTCCRNWTQSIDTVVAVLCGDLAGCETCADRKVMDDIAQQYRARHSQWWVVDRRRVIPIWIVEQLRNYRKDMSLSPDWQERLAVL